MKNLSWLLMVALLSGCARMEIQAPGPEGRAAWKQRQHTLQAQDDWRLGGRISVIAGEDGWHASLYWRQRSGTFQVRIIAPLGQGTVELQGDGSRVRQRSTRHPRPLEAASAEQLLRRVMGWEVPVGGMRMWVRGLALPNTPYRLSIDHQGRPLQIVQSGWTIRYLRYRRIGGVDLPTRIRMQNRRLKVKLVISKWN